MEHGERHGVAARRGLCAPDGIALRGRTDLIKSICFENAFFENAFFENFANFWRARSRLYQKEILQENMRSTAFFKLYKICILCTAAISKFTPPSVPFLLFENFE